MASRFAFLYRRYPANPDFAEVVTDFRKKGITLEHISDGAVYELSEEGDTRIAEKELLISKLNSAVTTSFLWWMDDSVDIYCRFRFSDNLLVEEYGLEGLDKYEYGIVSGILLSRFAEGIQKNVCHGIVIDWEGVTEDYDWDDFFCFGGVFNGTLPDFLGFEKTAMANILSDYENCKTEESDDFVLLRCA